MEKNFVQIGTSDKVTSADHFNKKISKNSTNMANSNCRSLIYKIKFVPKKLDKCLNGVNIKNNKKGISVPGSLAMSVGPYRNQPL